jgi:hypothetical protein
MGQNGPEINLAHACSDVIIIYYFKGKLFLNLNTQYGIALKPIEICKICIRSTYKARADKIASERKIRLSLSHM